MGQNPIYFKIDKTKGLPSNSIYDITQDKKGFMWFATEEGMCQYDGKKVILFQNKNQTSKSGSCLVEDKLGRMWYSNFDGKLFYVENNILKSFSKNNPIGYSKFGIIDNYLITIETNKIAMYDIRNLKLKKNIPINSYVGFISHASKDFFYAIANEKLYIISKSLKIKTLALPKKMKLAFPFLQNSNDNLLLVSNGKTFPNGQVLAPYCYTLKNDRFTEIDLPNTTTDFFQNVSSTTNEAWICTTAGVYEIGKNQKLLPKIFKDFNITAVFKDNSNQYWFATSSNGVLLVPKLEDHFFVTSNPITQMETANNTLYFGTSNDQVIQSDIECTTFKTLYQGSSNHEVGALKMDIENGKILFTSQKFKIINSSKKIEQDEFLAIKGLTKMDDTYYSFAATGLCGLIKISNEKSSWDPYFKRLKTAIHNPSSSSFKRIISVGRGKATAYNSFNKSLYFATSEGLFAVTNQSIKEIKINQKTAYLSTLKNYKNSVLGLDNNGEMYCIASNNSISKCNYLPYTNTEIAKSLEVYGTSLYLFTNLSVYQYSIEEHKSKKVFVVNPEFELRDLAVTNDYIYFGSSKGILKIKKTESLNSIPPKIIVTQIKANDTTILQESNFFLESNENTIAINFSVLNFIPNQKNEIYYKINQQQWRKIDEDSRQLLLNSLSSGNYKILFRTQINGISSSPVSLFFTIKNPIWLQWWFIAAVILLFFSLLYWIYRWQIEKIKTRNQILVDKINLEKNANQSKLKAIKSQMNPHFFYNALNTLQSYILSNEKMEAIEYLSKFSNLTRSILEMTEKEWITISEELTALKLYLDIEKGRFDNDFQYEIKVDSNIEEESIKIPSMLLQPCVENAIKHGLLHKSGLKFLSISFVKEQKELQIVIDDNGIGRKKSMELKQIKNKMHQSFATEALKNRIALLNQYNKQEISIAITDKYNNIQQATGTIVTIKIPIFS